MNSTFILILTLMSNGASVTHIEIVGENNCEDAGKHWLASVKEADKQGNFDNTKATYVCVPKR